MPVHFNSFIVEKEDETNLLSSIIAKDIETVEEIFASKDKKTIHSTKFIVDQKTNKKIGKTVVTMIVKENSMEIVDVDITLLSEKSIELNFLEKLDKSSESNEYYEVSSVDDERHFQIETVNRYFLEKDDIQNTKQKVYLSFFPFRLKVFNNMEELNKEYGFSKPIKTKNTDLQVVGYAEDMIAVGGIFTGDFDEPSSFVIGKIKEFKDVISIIGEMTVQFTIVQIETAVGIIPVATSRELFDLRNMEVGKIICILTDVKADFKK